MIQMQHPVTIGPAPAARRRGPVRAGAAALGVLLAAALVAPVGAANREHQQLMADIRMLQEQNQQMQLTLAQLGEALKAITTRLDAQQDANRKAFADQRLVADALAVDLRVLREKVDDTNVRLSGLAQELDALRVSIPVQPLTAPAPVEGGAPVPPSGAPGAAPLSTGAPAGPETPVPAVPAPATTPPAAPNPAAGLSPQRLWNQAYADYGAGQWALAIAGFETFLRSFPRSEQADKAQRYIGESYLLDGKFQQAVEAYDRVITTYPNGTEVPLAYYKKGLALVRLGQQDRARDAWQTVVTKYADSDAAILARQGLDRIAKPPR
jgi:tol-pal system protein YbgF